MSKAEVRKLINSKPLFLLLLQNVKMVTFPGYYWIFGASSMSLYSVIQIYSQSVNFSIQIKNDWYVEHFTSLSCFNKFFINLRNFSNSWGLFSNQNVLLPFLTSLFLIQTLKHLVTSEFKNTYFTISHNNGGKSCRLSGNSSDMIRFNFKCNSTFYRYWEASQLIKQKWAFLAK